MMFATWAESLSLEFAIINTHLFLREIHEAQVCHFR